MSEGVFRNRLLRLWLSTTVVGLLVSRVLSVTTFHVQTQRIIYLAIWLAAELGAIVLYWKGSDTDHAERAQILAEAHVKKLGSVALFCSMLLFAIMQMSLVFGVWAARTAVSWGDMAFLCVQLIINLGITATLFQIIRNAHLRRIDERDSQEPSREE